VFLGYSNMYNGFKCLDVNTSRIYIYISRDIVFDENIFPFSKLHPNAGAKLRSEILLLPPSLVSSEFYPWGVYNIDQSVVANFPNHVDKDCGVFDDVQVATTPGGAEHEGDSGTESCPGPAARSTQRPVHHVAAPRVAVVPKADSLVPDSAASCVNMIPVADSPRQAAAPELSLGGIDLKADSPASMPEKSRSAVHPRCVASPAPAVADRGSIEQNFGHPSPASHHQSPVPQPQRPPTRFSEGIKKPRVYTDGTIRYGMLTTTREPSNLDDALSDSNWKQAMDAKFSALMCNKTWHLVPPQKGANIIGCK
jgi:hypothetical protein